jgi:dienelactone hydrolase
MIARRTALLGLALLAATPARASYPEYRLPEDLAARRVTFLSDGTPLVGHFVQAKAQQGQRLPTVILCQGTGGVQHYHLPQAITLARAGYTVVTFDYRGWGESRGRLVPVDKAAPPRKDGQPASVQAIEVRETVDPVEQTLDVLAAIAFAAGEPEVDASRLGLWGTSLGAGIVAEAMVLDTRVKAVVAQVGAYDLRRGAAGLKEIRDIATKRVRGEIPYPAPKPRAAGQLHGHMIREHYQIFAPIEDLGRRPNLPAVLVIDAANDELIDIRQHGERFHERLTGPKHRVVLPSIKHYDVYRGESLEQVRRLAVEWYDKHLK